MLTVLFSLTICNGQGGFRFPSLNEARSGFTKEFKIPSLKDYEKFSNNYAKHLRMLDRRSEKAYRKSFLKFVEIEDELLYSLCDSNEFRANMLMRSASASLGYLESQRNRKGVEASQPKDHQRKSVQTVVSLSHQLLPDLDNTDVKQAEAENRAKNDKFGSKFYSEYMQKRVALYPKTFKDGTKQQKKMVRKLQKRALLWQSYKQNDQELVSQFAGKHQGVMRSIKATDSYGNAMKASGPDYSGTHIDPAFDPTKINPENILDQFKGQLTGAGILTNAQTENVQSFSGLLKQIKEARSDTTETAVEEEKEKPAGIDKNAGKRFVDRLYGGADFNWKNSTGYYPDGVDITLTGGYKISDNSGLNLEFASMLNGAKMGWAEDKRFESTLISNYRIGANVDRRIWKVIYMGAGAEIIVNEMNYRAERMLKEIKNTKHMLGVPLILRAIIPVKGSKSTTLELRYDFNSKQNIKPTFDFKVGFLIGR